MGLTGREKRIIGAIGILAIIGAAYLQIVDNQSLNGVLQRSTYGEGDKEILLEVEVNESPLLLEDKVVLDLLLGEQEYTLEEVIAVFDETIEALDEMVLGENESGDQVYYDLNFPATIPETSIQVSWSWEPYSAINLKGEIQEDYISEEGTYVMLSGTLTYGEEQAVYEKYICIYPEPKTVEEAFVSQLKEEVVESEEESRVGETFLLPEEIGGYSLTWYEEKTYRGYVVLLLGACAIFLIPYSKKKEKQEKEKRRKEALERDYFQVVQTLSLYIGAGMTVKNAWKRMVDGYEKKCESSNQKKTEVFEEMVHTYREMTNGISEVESYEHFGRRCGIRSYRRLGLLLSQNVRKGTKGLKSLLEQEAFEASSARKTKVRQEGEKAGTKLLLPMFLMLTIVLIIILVPAFFSIQI